MLGFDVLRLTPILCLKVGLVILSRKKFFHRFPETCLSGNNTSNLDPFPVVLVTEIFP